MVAAYLIYHPTEVAVGCKIFIVEVGFAVTVGAAVAVGEGVAEFVGVVSAPSEFSASDASAEVSLGKSNAGSIFLPFCTTSK